MGTGHITAVDAVYADSLDTLAMFNKNLAERMTESRQEARLLKQKIREEASQNQEAQDLVQALLHDTSLERTALLASINTIAKAVEPSEPSSSSATTLQLVRDEVKRCRDFLQTSIRKSSLDMRGHDEKLKLSHKESSLLLDKLTNGKRYAIPALEEQLGEYESKSSELDGLLASAGARPLLRDGDGDASPTRRSLDTAFEKVDPLMEKDAEIAALRAQLADGVVEASAQAQRHVEAAEAAALQLEQATAAHACDKAALEAEVARLEGALAACQAELVAASDEAVAAMRYAQDMLASVEASRMQAQAASYQQRSAAEEMVALREAAEAGKGAVEEALATEQEKTAYLQRELLSLRDEAGKTQSALRALESKTQVDSKRAAEDDAERRGLMKVLDQLTAQLAAAHDESKHTRLQAESAEEKFLQELQTLLEANRVLEEEVAGLHYEAAENHARANDALMRMATARELEVQQQEMRQQGGGGMTPPRTPLRGEVGLASPRGTPGRSGLFDDDAPLLRAASSAALSHSSHDSALDTSGDFDLLGHSYAADRTEILQRQVDVLQADNDALSQAMAASRAQMDAALTILQVDLGEARALSASLASELEVERLKLQSLERIIRQHSQEADASPSPAKTYMSAEQERLLEKMFDAGEKARIRLLDKAEATEKELRAAETGKALFQTACKAAKVEAASLQEALAKEREQAASARLSIDAGLQEVQTKLAQEQEVVRGQFAVMAKLAKDCEAAKEEAEGHCAALRSHMERKVEMDAALAAKHAKALTGKQQEHDKALASKQKEMITAAVGHAQAIAAVQQELAAATSSLSREQAANQQHQEATKQAALKAAALSQEVEGHKLSAAKRDETVRRHLEATTASEEQVQALRKQLEMLRGALLAGAAAEQRAVDAERRVAEVEQLNLTLTAEVEQRTVDAQQALQLAQAETHALTLTLTQTQAQTHAEEQANLRSALAASQTKAHALALTEAQALDRCSRAELEVREVTAEAHRELGRAQEALRAAEVSLESEHAALEHANLVAAQTERELRHEADAVRASLRRVEAEKHDLAERLESVNLQLLARNKEATVMREGSAASRSSSSSSSTEGGGGGGTPSAERSAAQALTRSIEELRTKRSELAKLKLDFTCSTNAMKEEMAAKERLLAEKEAERQGLAKKLRELEGLLEEMERRLAAQGTTGGRGSLSTMSASPVPRHTLVMPSQPGGSLLKGPPPFNANPLDISMLVGAGDDSFSSSAAHTPGRDGRGSRPASEAMSPLSFTLDDALEEVDFSSVHDDDEGGDKITDRKSGVGGGGKRSATQQPSPPSEQVEQERRSQQRRLESLTARNAESVPRTSRKDAPSPFNLLQAIPLPFFGFQSALSGDSQDSAASGGSSAVELGGAKDLAGAGVVRDVSDELVTCQRELTFTLSRLEATMQSKQRLALSAAAAKKATDERIAVLEEQLRGLLQDVHAFGQGGVAASRDCFSDTGSGLSSSASGPPAMMMGTPQPLQQPSSSSNSLASATRGAGGVLSPTDPTGPANAWSSSSSSSSSLSSATKTPNPNPNPTKTPIPGAGGGEGGGSADRVAELERELRVARTNSKMSTSTAQRAASATAIEMRVLRAELADATHKCKNALDECDALQRQAAAAEEEYAKAAQLLLETVESSRRSQQRRVDDLQSDLARLTLKAQGYKAKCEGLLQRRREEREVHRVEVEHLRRSLLIMRERGGLLDTGGESGEDPAEDSGEEEEESVISVSVSVSSVNV